MILGTGSKVLVSHRRLFEGDHARFFVGTVEAYEAGVARITGHTWIRDGYHGTYLMKGTSTKIISISSGTVIVYQLPGSVDIETIQMCNEGVNLVMRDRGHFEMDLTEGVLQGGSTEPARSLGSR